MAATERLELAGFALPNRKSKVRLAVRWAAHHKVAVVCIALLLVVSSMAIFPEAMAPYGMNEVGVGGHQETPSTSLWLGTDKLGRDQYSRLVYGARPSLSISAASTLIVMVIGVVLGVTSGYWTGWIDRIVMRVADTVMAFPILILGLAFVTAIGPGVKTVIIVLAATSWPRFARLARASTLAARQEDYVLAARTIGAGHLRISLRHILPNIASPLIVQSALMLSVALLAEAGLSFLGLGIPPPNPSWGRMVSEGQPMLRDAPWLSIAPGVTIFVTVLALNLLGDALRDTLDPRLRGR